MSLPARTVWPGRPATGLLLLPLCAGAALCQIAPDTGSLSPVVVTATRVPFAQSLSTTSTSVITSDDLRARGIVSLADALRDVVGAALVQTGSPGGVTSLFLRGGQSNYAKVLVDGVPINDPGGAFTFENLTVANVDRIEVVRGPTSVLYGSDAVMGVIQIFTKRGSGPAHGSLAGAGGTYKSVNATMDLGGSVGPVGYSAGGARETTAGILPFNNQYTNGELSGRLDLGAGSASSAAVTARYHTSDYHFPTLGSGVPVDRNQHRRTEGSAFGLDAARDFSRKLTGHVQLTSNSLDAANINPPDGGAADTGVFSFFQRTVTRRLGTDAHLDGRIGDVALLTVGGSLEGQSARTRSAEQFNFPAFPPPDSSATPPTAYFRRVEAGYAALVGNVGPMASYTAGFRVDRNSAFGTFGTYRLSGGYLVGAGVQVHAAIGTAFKEPTFEQNFSAVPFDSGNTHLRPERSLGWEVGLSESPFGQGLTLSATYFAERFRNVTDYTPIDTLIGGRPTNYINIAGANTHGVEVGLEAGPVAGTALALWYTGLTSRVTDLGVDQSGTGQFRAGSRLIRRPSHQFTATLREGIGSRASGAATVRFVGTRDDIDFTAGHRVVLPGYTAVDLAGDYRLIGTPTATGFSLTVRATNLLKRRYQEVATFAAPGRTILVGGRLDVHL